MTENNLIGLVLWTVGIIVSLAVGSGMIDSTLNIPGIPTIITVVVGAIVSVILAIFNK